MTIGVEHNQQDIRQVNTNRGRFYEWQGELFKSVTTVLQIIEQPWLAPWKAKLASEFAVDNIDILSELVERGERDAAVKMVKDAANRRRDSAADRGTAIHEVVEKIARGQTVEQNPFTHETWPYVESFLQFVDDYQPVFTAVEQTVASREGMYAGTLDFRCLIKDFPCTFDVKTGKVIDTKHVLQLAAYNHAEFTVVDGKEVIWEPTVYAGILQLTPTTYKIYKVEAGPEAHAVFLAAKKLYDYVQQRHL